MLGFIGDTLTIGVVLGVVLAGLARILPNDKLYVWGQKSGRFFNNLGTAKMGSSSWERVEDFLTNSIGEYLRGMKDGLNEGEDQ